MQNLRMLSRLRNDLIHHEPLDEFEAIGLNLHPRPIVTDLQRFRGGQLLAGQNPTSALFIDIISSGVMARWACDTAIEMISSSINLIGDVALKTYLQFQYLDDEFKWP